MKKLSFLFLGANSPWSYGLAEALAEQHFTHAIQFYDWRTYTQLQPTWSSRTPPTLLRRSIKAFPPGYAGEFEGVFRFYLQHLIKQWYDQAEQQSYNLPWVIITEPYLILWVRPLPSKQLIYYNFDDYTLYRPTRKTKILQQETELIERSAITLCAAHTQTIAFQNRHPLCASRIHHYPHGVVASYINSQPYTPPEARTVGYVGNLGDRLDWQFIQQIVRACPDIKFVFVGGRDDQNSSDRSGWQATREEILILPNVRHIEKVPSDQVPKYYWSFAINWIPYRVDHPFNQASCPTKIMDGIASGRPVLSTNLPECQLYPDWITIFNSIEEAKLQIYQQLAIEATDKAQANCLKQLQFAHSQTWQQRAKTLEYLLAS